MTHELSAEECAKLDHMVDVVRGILCHNCQLADDELTKGVALGSYELVYECIDPCEVCGILDDPCTDTHNQGCYVDPREVDDLSTYSAEDIRREVQ